MDMASGRAYYYRLVGSHLGEAWLGCLGQGHSGDHWDQRVRASRRRFFLLAGGALSGGHQRYATEGANRTLDGAH